MPDYLNPLNTHYIEGLLAQYEKDPSTLDTSWRYFFDGVLLGNGHELKQTPIPDNLEFEIKVLKLIHAYREMGYLIADINPLDRSPRLHPLLNLENFGLSQLDLERPARVGQILGLGKVALKHIIASLKKFYCSPVTVELRHIDDPFCRQWLQKRVETNFLLKPLEPLYQKHLLAQLIRAEVFETFLHKHFVGQKRFSIEGNDVLIPMMDYLIDQAALLGADEIIMAMSHRGRLNILANIFAKDLKIIFAEFAGQLEGGITPGDGDVKYHMGYSHDVTTLSGKTVHLSLTPNPSHLEAINPVVMGITRSKQKRKNDISRTKTLAVLIHGDASFSGQGSVYELLNMSELEGYTIGGTLHIIVNNQIGFTTTPEELRSTPQATDGAKMLEIPIFRVNADEPEAALRSVAMALQYRYTFKRDVVIDLVGYRRYGHNEGDDPSFTQPAMYHAIDAHPRVGDIYRQKLLRARRLSQKEAEDLLAQETSLCDSAYQETHRTKSKGGMQSFTKRWQHLTKPATGEDIFQPAPTGLAPEGLAAMGQELTSYPRDFTPHPKIVRLNQERSEMLSGRRGLDWSLAEALAFGSLSCEGHMVRLAGQDVARGTFAHRHSVFADFKDGHKYTPLNHLRHRQSDFEVVNSLLSEFAALGFEFGQSLANPDKLTMWEAQFGDFANGAQVIIDQFITSSAIKWQRYSGLTLLLPHGLEGQGPEHSSARLERFLAACAQNNIQVCYPTTPAQYFHVLRRQLKRPFRLPLILMTPKSLLRHPRAVSSWEEFTGSFQEILDDPYAGAKKTLRRVILCSGKIYYELLQARQETKKTDSAIVRIEQFYPFHGSLLSAILAAYSGAKEVIWCQEEPQNMGGYSFMLQRLLNLMGSGRVLKYVGRAAQASPADGYTHLHQAEQQRIVLTSLGAL